MRVDMDKACVVLNMLLEGMSIRACSRITGVKPDTVCDLILHVGQNCDRFLEANVKNVACKSVQLDECWDFFHCKARSVEQAKRDGGDIWTWLAICADSKLILSHTVGQRDESACLRLLRRLNGATVGEYQVTSDGYNCYTLSVPFELGSRISFAQLIKSYSASQEETRYSPATITGIEQVTRFGNPDEDLISTSYSERLNLSVRMHVRRYTRLTNAHSKTPQHHTAMTSLFVAWYNYCRKNMAVRGTPAMAAGLTDHVGTIKELLQAAK